MHPDDKKLPLDGFTAEAILRHFEAEAAFGAVEWPRIADPRVLAAAPAQAPQLSAPQPSPPVVASPPPAVAAPIPAETLAEIAKEIAACRACGLHATRTNVVPGQGDPRARLVFVGEAPGEAEDESGKAFVGRAGMLLTDMIKAMGLTRDQVFIVNVLKCRPPMNRAPEPEEKKKCLHFLERQIAVVNPEVICALGTHAATSLLGCDETIGRLRGRVHAYGRSQLIATYHPSYLLRSPDKKKEAWADLQAVMRLLGLEIPKPPSARGA